jgi:hypothetical protein
MWGISTSDRTSSPHGYEAVKDEARLIQDSLLPGGTLRGPDNAQNWQTREQRARNNQKYDQRPSYRCQRE